MRLLLVLFFMTGLMACEQRFDTKIETSSEPVVTNAGATGPKLYVFDCGRIRLVSVDAFNLQETDTDVRELSAHATSWTTPRASCCGMRAYPRSLLRQMVR